MRRNALWQYMIGMEMVKKILQMMLLNVYLTVNKIEKSINDCKKILK